MEKKMEPTEIDKTYLDFEDEIGLYDSPAPPIEEIMPGVTPMWYGELAKLHIPPPSWIIDQLIPDGGFTILSAAPAQFKTWLALDIAIHVAQGKPLFDQFETKQKNVLIIDEESGAGLLRERLQILGTTDNLPIAVVTDKGFKLDETSANALIAYCEHHHIGLIVFDSLTRFHNGDENKAQDMSVVMGDFKRLSQAGIAVLLIHHNRKPAAFGKPGGANEMRGSGDIFAACDVQISMKRDDSSRTIKVTQNKNRYAEEMSPFNLELVSDDGRQRFEYRGNDAKQPSKTEQTDDAIGNLLNDGEARSQTQIIEALKGVEGVGGERKIADRLKALHKAGELTRTLGASGKHVYGLRQVDE